MTSNEFRILQSQILALKRILKAGGLTTGQYRAIEGTAGEPSQDNPFVTDEDPRFDATFLTSGDETAILPNARQLLAGTGITLDATVPGELTIEASGSAGALWMPMNIGPFFLTLGGEPVVIPWDAPA